MLLARSISTRTIPGTSQAEVENLSQEDHSLDDRIRGMQERLRKLSEDLNNQKYDILLHILLSQESKFVVEVYRVNPSIRFEDEIEYPTWLTGESLAEENPNLSMLDDSLLCKEIFDSSSLISGSEKNTSFLNTDCGLRSNEIPRNNSASYSLSELANLEFDTPHDIPLVNLQFGSQESILSWLERIFGYCLTSDFTHVYCGCPIYDYYMFVDAIFRAP